MTKTCTKCHKELPSTTKYFSRLSRSPSGLHPRCKCCMRSYNNEIYAKNPKPTIRRSARWQRKNRRKRNQYSRNYYLHHSVELLEITAQWSANHQDKRLNIDKHYRQQHPDRLRAKQAKQRSRRNQAKGSFTEYDVAQQLKKQHNICYWCKQPLNKYHVDHVIPLSKGGSNWPSNLVCTCPHCNTSKGARTPNLWRRICLLLATNVKPITNSRSSVRSPQNLNTHLARQSLKTEPSVEKLLARSSSQPPSSTILNYASWIIPDPSV